jgi:hypothetical protein
MKKNQIASFVSSLLVLVSIFVFSCNKSDQEEQKEQTFREQMKLYEKIGVAHNQGVKYVLENTRELPEENALHQHIHSLLKTGIPDYYRIFEENNRPEDLAYLKILENESPDYKKHINNLNLSSDLIFFVNKTIDLTAVELPYEEFDKALEGIEREAFDMLSEKDLVIFFSTTSVFRYSTKLWYPESMGGEDGLKYLKVAKLGESVQSRTTWWKIITADGVGMVGGALNSLISTGGASAIPNPLLGGVPTAGAVAVIGGAVASGNMAIGQY